VLLAHYPPDTTPHHPPPTTHHSPPTRPPFLVVPTGDTIVALLGCQNSEDGGAGAEIFRVRIKQKKSSFLILFQLPHLISCVSKLLPSRSRASHQSNQTVWFGFFPFFWLFWLILTLVKKNWLILVPSGFWLLLKWCLVDGHWSLVGTIL